MAPDPPLQGKTALSKLPVIAIIDDDASVRATTDSLLRSLGYIAYTFTSAEEFLRSSYLSETFTAFPDERTRAQALRAGAICYLIKPFDEHSLIQCLDAALDKHGDGNNG